MYARGGGGGLVGADPQVCRRNDDLTEEEQEAREERDHGGDEEQGHTTRLKFTPRESWLQRGPCLLERPRKVADVVERLARQGLGHVARRHGSPDHDEPRVVIFHRQATVVLRALDLAYILTFEHGAARDGLGIREHVGLTLLRLPHIDNYGGMIVREDF